MIVCVCILALVTRHANRVFPAPRYVVTCGLSGATVLLYKRLDLRAGGTEYNMRALFYSTTFI